MRLIDVCIPNFDDDDDGPETISTTISKADAGTFRLPPTLFRPEGGEYHIEEDQHSQTEEETSTISPEFFLSDDGDIQVQHLYNSVIADTDVIHARHLSCVNQSSNSIFTFTIYAPACQRRTEMEVKIPWEMCCSNDLP